MITFVEKTIAKYDLLQKNDRVLVAVSGGADSLALLHCLYTLKNRFGLTLFVAHLNHMFRGAEADRDAEYVKGFADKLGLKSVIERINVPEILAQNSFSPQEGARIVRYDFLIKTAEALSCNKIALGHHKDDQAETILLNLFKGAGLDGLKGIAPKRDPFVRPLIEIKKETLEKYCEENKLTFFEDGSNFKDVYLRNKIRNRLMPILKNEFNSKIVDVLSNTADILREENAYLDSMAEKCENQCRVFVNPDLKKGEWLTKPFIGLPIALQRRVIRQIYALLKRNNYNLSFFHVEVVRSLISQNVSGSSTELPGQLVVIYSYDRLKIMPKEAYYSQEGINYSYELSIPGTLFIGEINASIEARCLSPSETIERLELKAANEAVVAIEPDDILIIRNRRPGDRIMPVGMSGTKKLKDLFIDEKVEKIERDRVPVILSKNSGKVIWVAGLRISEEFRNTLDKNSVLLRFVKEE
ncbi:tRNA lysidine(34) synthetase TilS [Desulfitibacter alkalitolerans]|uniref:tRNA lysidine(34) synthetase TilS n=1 Tax=Desulfitibacter alkalitolerans TaxID=264641 RepID=UPI0004844D88|nr:tRNA lysidine(34) synthetase TilS [Desulfitibacter alkalitolerans]